MSGWIKVEKDLANDPRVLRMSSRLSNGDVTVASRSRLIVIGALVTLWWYADTHIGDDDVLAIGANEIDQLVGLEGFCSLVPSDWLQILDADHVKLVDYTAHNGSHAKNRALAQKRQQRHRDTSSMSRSRHARVTQDASPDKTRQDKTETRRKRVETSSLPPAASQPERAPEFADFKSLFPRRAGSQPWDRALKAINARLGEGHTWPEILDGTRRYAEFIRATGKERTDFVLQAATFVGPSKHFLNPYELPATKADSRLANNLSAADEFMRRTEGSA